MFRRWQGRGSNSRSKVLYVLLLGKSQLPGEVHKGAPCAVNQLLEDCTHSWAGGVSEHACWGFCLRVDQKGNVCKSIVGCGGFCPGEWCCAFGSHLQKVMRWLDQSTADLIPNTICCVDKTKGKGGQWKSRKKPGSIKPQARRSRMMTYPMCHLSWAYVMKLSQIW